MDVNTSQTALISANNDVSSATSASKVSNNKQSTEKSFEEEMKSATKSDDTKNIQTDEKAEQTKTPEKDTKSADKEDVKSDKNSAKEFNEIISSDKLSGELNYTDYKYNNNSQTILTENIQSLLNTKDLISNIHNASKIDYDSVNMSDNDANFFANLVQNTNMSMKSIMNEIGNELIENTQATEKNIKVSSVLMEKLSDSLKTNKPFRIDFDKDVSVIIKVNKDGSLAANFIPGDKAVEQYLRNNIASLRQRFDEENLSYSELTYSNSKNGQQQRRKKENNNE